MIKIKSQDAYCIVEEYGIKIETSESRSMEIISYKEKFRQEAIQIEEKQKEEEEEEEERESNRRRPNRAEKDKMDGKRSKKMATTNI